MLFAVGREMNFSEEEMMNMPLAKLYQYAHCALLFAGCATKWTHKTAEEKEQDKAILQKLKSLKK